jgi:predicted dehydrogenase
MNRRTVLQSAPLFLRPDLVFGSQANSTIELGLIGCGGRGNWIAPLFTEYAPTRFVAVADVVRAKLDSTRDKLKVDASRAYYGPDAYRELAH